MTLSFLCTKVTSQTLHLYIVHHIILSFTLLDVTGMKYKYFHTAQSAVSICSANIILVAVYLTDRCMQYFHLISSALASQASMLDTLYLKYMLTSLLHSRLWRIINFSLQMFPYLNIIIGILIICLLPLVNSVQYPYTNSSKCY